MEREQGHEARRLNGFRLFGHSVTDEAHLVRLHMTISSSHYNPRFHRHFSGDGCFSRIGDEDDSGELK